MNAPIPVGWKAAVGGASRHLAFQEGPAEAGVAARRFAVACFEQIIVLATSGLSRNAKTRGNHEPGRSMDENLAALEYRAHKEFERQAEHFGNRTHQ